MDKFTGTICHSSAHDSAKHWRVRRSIPPDLLDTAFINISCLQGKKILVVGTSSSGFDAAFDAARHGVDVTMLQRAPTYVMRYVFELHIVGMIADKPLSLTHGAPAVCFDSS